MAGSTCMPSSTAARGRSLAGRLDLRSTHRGGHWLCRARPITHQWDPGRDMLTIGSDNGTQFTSRPFRQHLTDRGIVHRRGGYRDPESQAFIESWFGQFKKRCAWRSRMGIPRPGKERHRHVHELYHHRPHSGLAYRTPAEVAQTWQTLRPTQPSDLKPSTIERGPRQGRTSNCDSTSWPRESGPFRYHRDQRCVVGGRRPRLSGHRRSYLRRRRRHDPRRVGQSNTRRAPDTPRYATAAFVGALLYVLLPELSVSLIVAMWFPVFSISMIRICH